VTIGHICSMQRGVTVVNIVFGVGA
jgi:hypothetical protein